MTFREFLAAWRGNTLVESATWRAYDFENYVCARHVRKALKALSLSYAGEHAIPEFMARYALTDRKEAEIMVGAWWLMVQIDENRHHEYTMPKRTHGV